MRASEIYEKRLGAGNTRTGAALDSLGQDLLALGDIAGARKALERAVSIQSNTLGARHVWTGNAINALGMVAQAEGNDAEARKLFALTLDIWRDALGESHPFTLNAATRMANVLGHLGQRDEAFALALDGARRRRDYLASTLRTVEERQALRYASNQLKSLDMVLSLIGPGAEDRRAAWDAVVRARALVLDEMAARQRGVKLSGDPAVQELATALAGARSDFARLAVQGKGAKSQFDNEATYALAATAVRKLVWDPVAKEMPGAARVFVVADGALQALNFNALPLANGKYLAEVGPLVHSLSAERDVVGEAAIATPNTRLLAMGDVLFSTRASSPSTSRGWPADVFTGAGASETALKSMSGGARVIHLATHGFFLDSCAGSMVALENPLLRAGLALAGANQRQAAKVGEDDGVFTAEESSSLDLGGADWVVLSGCDTGVGQVHSGEGILGLRRAFQQAGAHTVSTSLWPVEDEEARRWMTLLYRRRFQYRDATAEALQNANRQTIASLRAAGKSAHPFHWASFVAVGDWR